MYYVIKVGVKSPRKSKLALYKKPPQKSAVRSKKNKHFLTKSLSKTKAKQHKANKAICNLMSRLGI